MLLLIFHFMIILYIHYLFLYARKTYTLWKQEQYINYYIDNLTPVKIPYSSLPVGKRLHGRHQIDCGAE